MLWSVCVKSYRGQLLLALYSGSEVFVSMDTLGYSIMWRGISPAYKPHVLMKTTTYSHVHL